MKDGAIYLLSRKVNGDHGEPYVQNVTVFANSAARAQSLVDDQFAALRKTATGRERAYQPVPKFSVERVSLDDYKMITAGVTKY